MDVTSATVHGVQSGSVFKIICSGNRRNGKRKERKAFAIKCPEVFNGISCSGLCFPIVSFPGTYPCMELKCLRL